MKYCIFFLTWIVGLASCAGHNAKPTHYVRSTDNICVTNLFSKSVIIFDSVIICSKQNVPNDKLFYTANVLAQWLDNDQDGVADEPKVVEQLKKNKATLIMSKNEFSHQEIQEIFDAMGNDRILQDLYANETAPLIGRDASGEETHHLVMNGGWYKVYPRTFSAEKTSKSSIYLAWEQAEEKGYYSYDDPTCEDTCKVTEYLYKATAAYLGSEQDLSDDEFTIKSKQALRAKHAVIVEIFENENYHYPTIMWPDGNYTFKAQHISKLIKYKDTTSVNSKIQSY